MKRVVLECVLVLIAFAVFEEKGAMPTATLAE
jgi:hypothetical protein